MSLVGGDEALRLPGLIGSVARHPPGESRVKARVWPELLNPIAPLDRIFVDYFRSGPS